MTMSPSRRGRGRPRKPHRSAEEILSQQVLATVSDACRILNKHRTTILDWEKKGLLPRRRQLPGGQTAFVVAELRAWVEQRPVVGAADQANS